MGTPCPIGAGRRNPLMDTTRRGVPPDDLDRCIARDAVDSEVETVARERRMRRMTDVDNDESAAGDMRGCDGTYPSTGGYATAAD
jgi:hypothetical protein